MPKNSAHELICAVRARAAARGITASFVMHGEKSHLMRIGNNSVSLNTSETLTRLDIEVTNGRRSGSHTQMGDVPSEDYVEKALQIALEKANSAGEKDYVPIPVVVEETIAENEQYDAALETLDPSYKADSYRQVMARVGENYNYSGSWSSGSVELFMVSTANDKRVYHQGTDQDFNVVLKHPEKKWELRSWQSGWRVAGFRLEEVVGQFKELLPVYESHEGFKLQPGEYTVALGSQALAEVLMMACYTGFYGRTYEEKQGWTAKNKIGDRIFPENFNLADDPTNNQTFRFGFDLSGKTRRPFPLVQAGLLQNFMYDSATAAKYGRNLTGHNVGSVSIVMPPGADAPDLLTAVKGMGRVLFIPALHYLNIPNPSQGIFTGSSRFNAVLIENGKVVSPIFSSRITDSFQNVLGNIRLASRNAVSVNLSNTYRRRSPEASSVPGYVVCEKVKITDSADSF
jgi:predicted Zn-dependent protease